MIQRASFRNFKSLENVDLDFERLTVIVGPNGSGKTSVLQALTFLYQFHVHGHPQGKFLLDRTAAVMADVVTRNTGASCIDISAEFEEDGTIARATYSPSDSTGQVRVISRAGEALTMRVLGEACPVNFLSEDLAKPSYLGQIVPAMEGRGYGLPSVLAHMYLKRPDQFQELQSELRKVIPSVKRIRFDRVVVRKFEDVRNGEYSDEEFANYTRSSREYIGDGLIYDFSGASDIAATQVSEGTLLVTGLLAVIFGSSKPNLLLIDDIDRAFHPKAQRELIAMLRRLMAERPELQIIATSHSPYLLDDLKPEEVRLSILDENGASHFGKLMDHPNYERWKDEMSPGEMWGMWGEKFLLDKPALPSALERTVVGEEQLV